MIFRLTCGSALAVLFAMAAAETAFAAKPSAGQYDCSIFVGNPPAPNYVGTFFLRPDNSYEVRGEPGSGKYSFDNDKQLITWNGAPPLGFEVAVVEQPDRYNAPRLRLYPKNSDVGNAWKAAVCYFQPVGKGQGSAGAASADPSATYTVGAKVSVLYQGELVPAVITAVGAGSYSVRYEANRYGFRTDAAVPPARLRPRY